MCFVVVVEAGHSGVSLAGFELDEVEVALDVSTPGTQNDASEPSPFRTGDEERWSIFRLSFAS